MQDVWILAVLLHVCVFVPARGSKECYKTTLNEYQGFQEKTVSGYTCQRWDLSSPHSHSYNDTTKYPNGSISDASNYCRDPSGTGVPWCYTTDPDKRWEYCDIYPCTCTVDVNPECFRTRSNKYRGFRSQTTYGVSCQRWDNQIPREHQYTNPADFPDSTLFDAANYCRDPSETGLPWCYTIDASVERWQFCNILLCEGECFDTSANEYEGVQSQTAYNTTCQRWDSQHPHVHTYTDPESFPDATLTDAANYCRDPSVTGLPWCYTSDPAERWQFCDIWRCEMEEECFDTTANGYEGLQSNTAYGAMCQRWDSQHPHEHNYTKHSAFPDATLTDAANYCRDPSETGLPWCYTSDPAERWQFCDIWRCETPNNCFKPNSSQYKGNQAKTVSGFTCQRWDVSDPHSHSYTDSTKYPDGSISDAANYCRDPSGTGVPWCFTTDPDKRWDYCAIFSCDGDYTNECFDKLASGYRGSQSETATGVVCQRWDSQSPREHNYMDPDAFPDASLAGAANYCRDPSATGLTWCYTSDASAERWQFCEIWHCDTPNNCFKPKSNQYLGTRANTMSGFTCQRWDASNPHSHSYTDSMKYPDGSISDAVNYCRDPSDTGVPWCYTTDPDKRWDYCALFNCDDDNEHHCFNTKASEYKGVQSQTVYGTTCQRWDSQSPREHTFMEQTDFPDDTLAAAANYCRDPSGIGLPWCYTTDPSAETWQFCGIWNCDVHRH